MNGRRAIYKKLRRRGSFDFPVLGVAAALDLAPDGSVKDARLVLGGVAPAPIEVPLARDVLVGTALADGSIQAAADACYQKAKPLDNTDYVMGWRKQMTRPFVVRALRELGGLQHST
jgi:CO/xanthine dehydrogenase FAD-binding subunit